MNKLTVSVDTGNVSVADIVCDNVVKNPDCGELEFWDEDGTVAEIKFADIISIDISIADGK